MCQLCWQHLQDSFLNSCLHVLMLCPKLDILCPLCLTVQMVGERARVVLMLLNASWQCTPY